jgi:hypothetical protein
MNAPFRVSEYVALGDVEDFKECCEVHAWYCDEGWISLQTAADNLQCLAERWALIDEIGQDAVQAIMATAIAAETGVRAPDERPRDGKFFSLRQRNKGKPPKATVDAFKYVVSLGDQDQLARWLRNHIDDAPALLDLLERAA